MTTDWADRLARRAERPDGTLDRGTTMRFVLAAYALFAATYLSINAYSVGRPAATLFLPGERRLPFVPEWEYAYVLGYLLPSLSVFALPDARRLARLLRAFALTLLVAYTTYLLFPVYFERPTLHVDSLATFLLSLEYLDKSYNHFPSLHVALSWLVYFACRDWPRCRGWLLPVVLAISVSTLFVKQHYLVDVLCGAALAAAAWRVASLRGPSAIATRSHAPAPCNSATASSTPTS